MQIIHLMGFVLVMCILSGPGKCRVEFSAIWTFKYTVYYVAAFIFINLNCRALILTFVLLGQQTLSSFSFIS